MKMERKYQSLVIVKMMLHQIQIVLTLKTHKTLKDLEEDQEILTALTEIVEIEEVVEIEKEAEVLINIEKEKNQEEVMDLN